MRICKDCGTVYSLSKTRCETCGTRLSEPMENDSAIELSDDMLEEKERRDEIVKNSRGMVHDGLANDKDMPSIPVTPARMAAGIIVCVAWVGALVHTILLFSGITVRTGFVYSWDILLMLLTTITVFPIGPIIALDSFAPSFTWALSHAFSHIYYKNLEPTDEYVSASAGIDLIFAVIALAAVVLRTVAVVSSL